MKFRYRFMIVLVVFIAALIYFGGDIKETVFETSASTTPMSGASLPTVSLR